MPAILFQYVSLGRSLALVPPPTPRLTVLLRRDLLSFTEASNARMIFGISMNTGQDLDLGSASRGGPFPYPWDPTNARAILQWTIDNKFDHLITGIPNLGF